MSLRKVASGAGEEIRWDLRGFVDGRPGTCRVVNLGPKEARLQFADLLSVPDRFVLRLSPQGLARYCRVLSRERAQVVVRITSTEEDDSVILLD
jgi:hypothetical protein